MRFAGLFLSIDDCDWSRPIADFRLACIAALKQSLNVRLTGAGARV